MSYHHAFPEPPPPPRPRPDGRHRQPGATAHRDRYGQQHWGAPSYADDPAHGWDDDAHRPDPAPAAPAADDDRREIRRLGSAYRRLRRVATLTALGYFVLYLLLSGYAPDLMTGRISGGLTTGVLLGLIQLPVALAAIAVYERIARRRVDPLAAAVRDRAEATAAARASRRPTGGARA
ncbi:DUF485 domain-containing protein [Streptomyces genisteinicus]|uniref:DUF485 domain-containing protein n=1 Tax=Streptomyces genisteinicus TaxID=2768068 RepID=A0A7H0HT33_9ACTN|nr:DUF485 domain-containing protein [Streptomyces genisteinicus]QNP63699.1 DUF485 domain-containing protein [Streptomyces genisteinicus]